MIELLALLLLLALTAFAAYVLFRADQPSTPSPSSYDAAERQYMPPEVASGALVLSEDLIRVRIPAKVVAKTDQVYLTTDGLLVPVENKTRTRDVVYDYDRVEISVQGFVLRHGRPAHLRKYQVASYGYVRVLVDGRRPRYHRVELESDLNIVSMRQRRLQIDAGTAEPRPPANARICMTCPKAQSCKLRSQVTH